LTSALDGSEWSTSRPNCFIPRETHWIGDWVGSRDGLDAMPRFAMAIFMILRLEQVCKQIADLLSKELVFILKTISKTFKISSKVQ
jgi:hypothetical protein